VLVFHFYVTSHLDSQRTVSLLPYMPTPQSDVHRPLPDVVSYSSSAQTEQATLYALNTRSPLHY
jgi:hypothetical protein